MPCAEMKDVAGASGGELENILRTRFQFFPICEEKHGIQIALDGAAVV